MASPLAAAIKLHGGPGIEEFRAILAALDNASIDEEYFSWGPSYELAVGRLHKAREKMESFIALLE